MLKEGDKWYIDYRGKVIAAPMVKVSHLPFRQLCESYGADLTMTEELIDKKLTKCTRKLITIGESKQIAEYRCEDKIVVQFEKGEAKHPPVALHVGTADDQLALQVARQFYEDYDEFSINMGCPKHFSVHGGMGVGLLKDFKRVQAILTTLKRNIDKPITCKIRLFPDEAKSWELMKLLASCNPDCVTIHGRFPDDRPKDPAKPELVKKYSTVLKEAGIPVCYNGDVFDYPLIEKFRELSGADSVMIARGALWNASIFRKEGFEQKSLVGIKLVQSFVESGLDLNAIKYVVKRMYETEPKSKVFTSISQCKDALDVTKLLTRDTKQSLIQSSH